MKLVELGRGVAASFCAKLFADLGADVIKVEPPDGDALRRRGPFPNDEADPARSGLFSYLNTNKLGV
ncbi:MAG: CoA transferase, partial [Chloroflexi bacterium]|nr:CoA transferase [Chloroflexota bacterium]